MREFQQAFSGAIAAPISGPLAVYRNTVLAGACQALADNFPVMRALLGEEMFAAIAADHAEAHPPTSPVLALYGADFADWTEEQPWIGDVPYLSDVARVERMVTEALFAADAPALAPSDLAGIAPDDWGSLCLTLHPAVQVSWSGWPAASLWLAHQDGDDREVEWRPEGVLVTRPGLAVNVTALEGAAYRLLLGVRRDESVAAAATGAASHHPGAEIGAAFASLINLGAFAAL